MSIKRKGLRYKAIALAATGLALSACGFDPAQVPVPGSGVSGPTYHVNIEFESALNLPAKSKVIANGAQVGVVDNVRVVSPANAPAGRGGYVVVEAEISDSVRLPKSSIAELRQNTLLGDIHLSLTTPKDGFTTLLRDGDTIGIDHTKTPVQLEDTMATMALFVQGGAVGQLQDMMARVNSVMPRDPAETARIAGVMGADVADLAAHLDQVDLLVNGLASNAPVLLDIEAQLSDILTPASVDAMNGTADSIAKTMAVFKALGPTGESLVWAEPLARSGDAAVTALVPLLTGGSPDLRNSSNLALLTKLLGEKVVPFAQHPSVNVTEVSVGDKQELAQIVAALRMIGMVR
ncbi:MlaD family protein [Nocardia camponoti]|uniref:Mce/MlaD domain-containing protein n=1 Tax=Nocardia camponoti TaxID=1616106 RepID=A0A917QVA5_9NOCA|nr:MlaD family protein [Nocardia camponoti]GGK69769.1 hypothetical protein GCM10011591_47430 [Nocardia camponoti]